MNENKLSQTSTKMSSFRHCPQHYYKSALTTTVHRSRPFNYILASSLRLMHCVIVLHRPKPYL